MTSIDEARNDPFVSLFSNSINYAINRSPVIQTIWHDAVKQKVLDPEIQLLSEAPRIVTPYTKGGKIYFEVNYLRFLWITSHCVLVATEGITKRESEHKWGGDLQELFEDAEFIDAFYLFQKALSARDSVIGPFPYLPDPSWQTKSIQATNALFHLSIFFNVYHEMAHIVLKHGDAYRELAIECEKEADSYALNLFTEEYVSDKDRRSVGTGIACCFYAAFFMLTDVHQIAQGPTHPDLDQRLLNILEGIEIEQAEIGYYLKRMTTIAFGLFLREKGNEINKVLYPTVDDVLLAYWKYFDHLK